MPLLWIGIALVFAILEVATVSLYAAFFAVGALAAAVVTVSLHADLLGQALAFGAVSVLGVVAVRRPLMRYLELRHTSDLLSGAPAMIGQTARVVGAISGPHDRGHVRIAGEDWPALTRDGKPIDSGVTVRIVAIDKTTLVVDPVGDDG